MITLYRICEPHNSLITDRRDLVQPRNDWKFAKDQFQYRQYDVNAMYHTGTFIRVIRVLYYWFKLFKFRE